MRSVESHFLDIRGGELVDIHACSHRSPGAVGHGRIECGQSDVRAIYSHVTSAGENECLRATEWCVLIYYLAVFVLVFIFLIHDLSFLWTLSRPHLLCVAARNL